MRNIKIGLIGYGFAGATFHGPLIASTAGMILARVASSNPDKVREKFPDAVVSDPATLIEASDIELVVIATPNASHHGLARQALLAGKHVVVDKPFTVSVEEARDLIQLAREHKLLLSVFHNRRWDGDFLTLKRCIESGMLGEINSYHAHFDRYRPEVRKRWREEDLPGAGTLYDLGAHLIDQALVLFGTPDSVSADIGIQRPGSGAADYFHLALGYGMKRVILHSASIVRASGPHFQVHGSTGSYIKYGLDPQEDALRAGRRPGGASWGAEPEAAYGVVTFERQDETVTEKLETLPGSYQVFYQQMQAAIADGGPLPVSAQEALNVIRTIEYAMQSSRYQRVLPFLCERTFS